MLKKIGIFGGTFDPVHLEHIKMADMVSKELGLDKLIIVPTFIPPHKVHSETATVTDRLNMLKIAFKDRNVEISDFEIQSGGKSYTCLTVEHFKNLYQDAQLYFIVGEDMLIDFKTWYQPERILQVADLAVFGREGYKADYEREKEYFINRFGKSFIKLSYTGKDISSTKIRVNAMFYLPLEDLDIGVSEYVIKNNVYPSNAITDIVRVNLPRKRLKHTANVIVCALKKVKELKLDREKVFIACALHDIAKYHDLSDYPKDVLPSNMVKPVAHAFLGEYYARVKIGITDTDILNAVKYHTSGRANMSVLEKLVFVADMIEEDRNYDGVDFLRKLYEEDFEKCFVKCLEEEMIHLKNKGEKIFEETINAYEFYLKENI